MRMRLLASWRQKCLCRGFKLSFERLVNSYKNNKIIGSWSGYVRGSWRVRSPSQLSRDRNLVLILYLLIIER